MKNKLDKVILRAAKLLLFALPSTVFASAVTSVSGGLDYFNFSLIDIEEDLSMTLLGMIFGDFNGLLPATGVSILTPVLEHFNQGIFMVAVGMVTYVTFLSTIKTAEEGKAMGEKTPMFWLLIRPILGTTLLVPTASGYSYLQSFMMTAVIMGVSFANSIWYTAVNTFNVYGTLSSMNSSSSSKSAADFNNSAALAQMLFESELCLLSAQAKYNADQESVSASGQGGGSTVPAPTANFNFSNNTLTYENMPAGYTGPDGVSMCGYYSFNSIWEKKNSFNSTDMQSYIGSAASGLYETSKSLAQLQYDTMDSLTDVNWATNTTICSTQLYTGDSISDLNCNLGAMLFGNAYTFQTVLQSIQDATVTSSGVTNTVNYNGGWIMAASAYYGLVSTTGGADLFSYNTFDPTLAFRKIDSSGNNSQANPLLCYLNNNGISANVPSSASGVCNIQIPESFLQYSYTNSDGTTSTAQTNWLSTDINGKAADTTRPNPDGGFYSSTIPSNAPKYMQLSYQDIQDNADNSSSSSYSSNFSYANTYQSTVCQQKGWGTILSEAASAATTVGSWNWNVSTENCSSESNTFSSPASGQVDIYNLPAVLSAQIYGTAINVFGGQDVSSGFQSQLSDIAKATQSGIAISGPNNNITGETKNMPLGGSGVQAYSYDNIPAVSNSFGSIMGGIFSGWDVSGSGSKFYDIYNNYIASILILWQNSFLNSDAQEPVGAVRDFGLKATSLSIEFIATMTQKIYMEQVLIMVKYIGYYILFSILAGSAGLVQGIIFLVAKIVYWALLWFFGLGAALYPAIYSAAFVPQAIIEPTFNAMANVAMMFMQMEIQGTFLWVPVVMSTAVPILTLALILAFYAPMIPFLIWCLASINWLIGVIESMVAAPVVALGITSPQGHDFLGKAELALMLIMAIFIRPAGMLFGLMFAVLFAYFGFAVFNYIMFYTMQIYLSTVILSTGGKAAAALMGFLLIMYCYTVITFINQIFSMIYQIPNKIMRWIGVPVDEPDEDQWLEEIKGGVTDAVSGLAGSSTSAGGEMAQGGMASSGAGSAQQAKGNVGKQSQSSKQMKSK